MGRALEMQVLRCLQNAEVQNSKLTASTCSNHEVSYASLIREHSLIATSEHIHSRSTGWQRSIVKRHVDVIVHATSTHSRWARVHGRGMLAKCESLRTQQLGALLVFDLPHTTLTSHRVLFRIHLDIVLRKAADLMILEECAVSAIKDVSLGVSQSRVPISIDSAVFVPDEFGHQRSTVSRVFAVKDKQCPLSRFDVEQLVSQRLLVIEVDCTVDVASKILVLKPAVDNDTLIIHLVVLSVKNTDHSLFCDSGKITSTIRHEMR